VCTNSCTVSAGKPLTTEYRCLCFRVCFNQPLWQSGQILPPGVAGVTIPLLRLEASNNSAGKDRGANRLLTVSGNSRNILMVGYPFTSGEKFFKGSWILFGPLSFLRGVVGRLYRFSQIQGPLSFLIFGRSVGVVLGTRFTTGTYSPPTFPVRP